MSRRFALHISHWVLGLAAAAVLAGPLAAQEDQQAELPLQKVVMFSSGVAFFDRSGEIQDDAQVDLKFNVDDINDLLKSMVLQDAGGGKISTINYGSKDPITKTLKTFSIDLTSDPTLAQLLSQIRGEKVQVSAPSEITGTILSVETRKAEVGGEVQKVEYLNLLTDAGLRSVPMQQIGAVKLLDEKLNAELRQALTVLASSHSTDKKTVTLKFTGEGNRRVRVGYIQEAPIWKTSYRLVLGDEEDPYLQGWAIVENTTEEDWKNVDLTLISGRPISFIMDLYQPLYVPRPLVEPELFASLRPQTYGQDLAQANKEFRKLADKYRAPGTPPAQDRAAAAYLKKARELQGRGSNARSQVAGNGKGSGRDESFDISEGFQSLAQSGEVGDLFQYKIDTPVTLPRRESAMLPIVNGKVKAEKVSIYNPDVQAKHPLSGLQLANSTGLHLMQGPITVFDEGAYAGDAQIQSLAPGSERLVSYALDLNTEVAIENRTNTNSLTRVRIVRGTLYTNREYRRSREYVVKNSGSRQKSVLIEYPKESAWKLTQPEEPEETTRDLYRFLVKAEPGVPAKLAVSERRPVSEQVALSNLNDNTIRIYIRAKEVSDAVKEALQEVIGRKQEIADLQAQRNRLNQQINVIGQEQDRIRRNMQQLDRNTDLYNRYVKKFGEQEDKIENLRSRIEDLIEEQNRKQQSLNQFLSELTVE